MGIEKAKEGKLLYHLTKVDNFESIVMNGLMPRSELIARGIKYEDVADTEIIRKRKELGLDKYTPFHFHPYTAFDMVVKRSNDPKRMMYLCIKRADAMLNGFKILPKHPLSLMDYKIYDFDEGIGQIDWETMTTKNLESTYAKEVKMAEALTDMVLPISAFSWIFVPSEEIKDELWGLMSKVQVPFHDRPFMDVMPFWFE